MKAILKAVLVGSVAAFAMPQASNAFSLSSMLGGHESQPAAADAASVPERPVLMAQAASGTVEMQQLEEAVRKLTGRVEDLNYQLLQMQEQMRQMQKDNEFRFERLEGGTSGAGAPPPSRDHTENTPPSSDRQAAGRQPTGALPGVETATTGSTATGSGNADRGTPPKQLGTMTFDSSGKMVGGSMAAPGSNASGDDTRTASLPSSASPQDIYRHAYNQLLHGDYKAAESGFHDYIDIVPDGPETADATYWLGETEFSQGKFNEAAKTFLDAHQKYPKAKKAPETLLKLGMALAALDNHDTACATYHEVLKRYPDASAEVHKKVAQEEQRTGC